MVLDQGISKMYDDSGYDYTCKYLQTQLKLVKSRRLNQVFGEMIAYTDYAYACGFLQSQLEDIIDKYVPLDQQAKAISEIITAVEVSL